MFYTNCRKMYEFFTYPSSTNPKFDDMRAREFTQSDIAYTFNSWTDDIQEHMNKQLMHMTRDRTTRTRVWDGRVENPLFRDEFAAAWKLFLDGLAAKLSQ